MQAKKKWMCILFYLIEIIKPQCTLWLSNKREKYITQLYTLQKTQVNIFIYSHIHMYIGEDTCNT